MSWPSYDQFYVGYTKNTQKNIIGTTCYVPSPAGPLPVLDSTSNQAVLGKAVGFGQDQYLYDGYIIFCAKAGEGELRLHEIFQEILDTPVGVGSQSPDM